MVRFIRQSVIKCAKVEAFDFDPFLGHMSNTPKSKHIWEWILFILVVSYLVPESRPFTCFVKYGQCDIVEDVALHLKSKPNAALKASEDRCGHTGGVVKNMHTQHLESFRELSRRQSH